MIDKVTMAQVIELLDPSPESANVELRGLKQPDDRVAASWIRLEKPNKSQ